MKSLTFSVSRKDMDFERVTLFNLLRGLLK
jgi:hypothetical protein